MQFHAYLQLSFAGEGRHLENDKRAVIFYASCIFLCYWLYWYRLLPNLPGRPFLHALQVCVNFFMWFSWISCSNTDPGVISNRKDLKQAYEKIIEDMVKTGECGWDSIVE